MEKNTNKKDRTRQYANPPSMPRAWGSHKLITPPGDKKVLLTKEAGFEIISRLKNFVVRKLINNLSEGRKMC